MTELAADVDQVVAAAAMIGGISYFHEFAFDLLAENERILASTFEAAIASHKAGRLRRIVVLSSSMVFESTTVFPTPEGAERTSPPPISTYGFQKLASEYFAHGAWEQYQLPYTILRPFNCVGDRRAPGGPRHRHHERQREARAVARRARPRARRSLKGQDPLHILGDGSQVRHYTYGGDLARGIRLAMESDAAVNDDFNLSTAASTTVLELAEAIWTAVHGPDKPFRYVSTRRSSTTSSCASPTSRKAGRVLGFEATTSLDDDARRGDPLDPRRARGGTVVTELSIVVPVFKEGEAVEPVLRALDAGVVDPARDPGRVRLRRGPHRPGHRAAARGAARRSAACATTSGGACSTR